jgi:putative tryptophan/tyrosine transport system substrate-binding protein
MERRALIRGLSAVAILAPTAGYAQALAKAARVGLVMTTTPVAASHIVVAFADSLRAFGYFEGKNLTLEYRWAEGRPERLDDLVADLIRQRSTSSWHPPRQRRWRQSEQRRQSRLSW